MREPTTEQSHKSSENPVILGDPRPALREFAGVAVVFSLLWLIPYVHPALADYRYFEQLDVTPLIRAVTFSQPPTAEQQALPGGLPGGAGAAPALSDEEEEAALAALDTTVRQVPSVTKPSSKKPSAVASGATAGETAPKTADPKTADPKTAAAKTAAAKTAAAKTAAPSKAPPPLPDALNITDATIGKPLAKIEHPERMGLFWQALVDRAKGKRPHVRIRHYGDSHLANDGISHVLRVLLQRRFGDGGHGYLLAASRTQWYHRKGVRWTSNEHWKPRNFLGGGLRDGAYGYGGVAAKGRAGASFRVRTKRKGVGATANRFELFWRGVASAALQVRIDGKTEVIKLTGDGKDTARAWDLPDGPHDIRVRVSRGRVRIYGAALERRVGLTYDSLGIVGARARRWLNANATHMQAQLTHRPASLVVFNYGGNSRNDKISKERYIDRYNKVIKRLRLGDSEACLVLGPTDHGKKKRGKIISEANTVRMIGWQREIADAMGCSFLDARALMGGDGSMGRWVKQGLGWADYGHLTPRGQRTLGKAIYGTWMAGLRQFLRR